MSLRLGDTAPNFEAETTKGKINFHEWAGNNWVVLYSHPADFTPVCTTEIGRTAQLADEFEKRGVKPIVLSVDSVEDHKKWLLDVNETQNTDVQFPIIADPDHKVAEAYDMIHPNETEKFTVRSVFIIDPNKKIRTTITYPPSTGRNFNEILRVIDSLKLTDEYSVATPVDWVEGEDVVVSPAIPTDEAREKFPKGVTEIKPYLRMTPQPNKD
ncbi:MAG TPA: peroxiredoxin [Saprospiraceae bacterium]|nr:peroxiredoxin [Saprospiraceae bacterium]